MKKAQSDYPSVTFVYDGSQLGHVSNFQLKGSFNPVTGEYDQQWNNGKGIPMFDDGTHGDLIAGDGLYSATVQLKPGDYKWGVSGDVKTNDGKVATDKWIVMTEEPPAFSVSADSKNQVEEYAKNCKIDKITPVIYIDKEVSLKNLNREAVAELSLLEPFGEANKMPLFLYKNLKIQSIRALSEGKHLKLTLKDENTLIDAIGFNMGELSNEYLIGNKIDVVGTLEINSFNNMENIQINLKDIRKSY